MTDNPRPIRPIYIKLGGSLITDKRQAETPRLDVMRALAQEIARVRRAHPDLPLIIGHGSGSFGHVVGSRYGTRAGVHSLEGWYGFAATGDAAARLNRLVTHALLNEGLPAWSLQPGVALRLADGRVEAGPEQSVALALDRGLIPVIYGDVALDRVRGGTIASTEEIFDWLMGHLPARRVVLLGEVDGVYDQDPQQVPDARLFPHITPQNVGQIRSALGGSHGTDVTGGMLAKVGHALDIASAAACPVVICSGLIPGRLTQALLAEETIPGTVITGSGGKVG